MVTRGGNTLTGRRRQDDGVLPEVSTTKLAYVSGLRVSPFYRRMGIGLKLVQQLEDWFLRNGAVYVYVQTENDNAASVKLFTEKCGYSKFRTPTFLVNPVFNHRVTVSRRVKIIKLTPSEAESLYRNRFSSTEFFPSDINSILTNKLSLGTFMAVPRDEGNVSGSGTGSWAVISIWNSKEVYKLQVKGASRLKRTLAKTSRVFDSAFPFLKIPSFPNLFKSFAMLFMYGIGGEGPCAVEMVEALCSHAHNIARKNGCAVVATEVASCEPLRVGIPHWKALSPEDLWCLKRLRDDYDGEDVDWTKSAPGLSIFVDPREI